MKHTKLNNIKRKKAYEAAKKNSPNSVADAEYIKKVNTLYKAKKLSGEKLQHKGIYKREALYGDSRLSAGKIKRELHYIGDMEVFFPMDLHLNPGTEYEIVGLYVNSSLFISQIDDNDLIKDQPSP